MVQCVTHPCNLQTLPFYCHYTISNKSSLNIKMFALHTMWRQGNFQQYMCTNLAVHHKEYEGRYLLSYKKHHNNDLRTFSEDCNTRCPCTLHLSFSTNNCCKNVTTYQNFRNIQISIPILGFFLGTLRNCSYNIIESKCIFSDSSLTRKGEKTLAILNLCHRCFCVN